MDKIAVSADGLREAYLALQSFRENTQKTTQTLANVLRDSKDNLDETFRKDLFEYLETLKAWSERVAHYTQENNDAILERLRALADYCSTTYTKQSL